MMKTKIVKLIFLVIAVASIQTTSAATLIAQQTDFSGSETVIDFNGIGNRQPVNNQYSGMGVVFNGSLLGLTRPEDTSLFNGSTIASNWDYGNSIGSTGSTWTATFSSALTKIGFFAESNTNDDITIEAFLNGASVGSINFPNANGITPDFLGIQHLLGIDSITVTTATKFNGFFAMDDFRFEGKAAVPVPAAIWLLGSGLLGLLGAGRMRKNRP